MIESETKTIIIKDVDKDIDDDTVMRFIEYLYSEDYTVPEPDVLQLSTDTNAVIEAFVVTDRGNTAVTPNLNAWNEPVDEESCTVSSSKKSKKNKRKKSTRADSPIGSISTPLEDDFATLEEPVTLDRAYSPIPTLSAPLDLEYSPHYAKSKLAQESVPTTVQPHVDPFADNPTSKTRRNLWQTFRSDLTATTPAPKPAWQPPQNNDQREDFTPIFLCHARLYKFSERYDVPGLMQLTLHRLRATLSSYKFHQERAVDVVELIRYTYTHTMFYGDGSFDRLRKMVLDYAVCYVAQLEKEDAFRELVREGGQFAGDMLSRMVEMVK